MTDVPLPTTPDTAHAVGTRPPDGTVTAIAAAVAAGTAHTTNALARARAFAEPLLANETLDTGENILAHADAMVDILAFMGGTPEMQAAAYLVYACQHLNRPYEVVAKAFGDNFAHLAIETTKTGAIATPSPAQSGATASPARGRVARRRGGQNAAVLAGCQPDRERAQNAVGLFA